MLTRIKLAGYGLVLSWLLNAAVEFGLRLASSSGTKYPGLAFIAAPVYMASFLLFAVPLAACCRAAWQLRFWYLLGIASLAWAAFPFWLFFHPSLKDLLGPWPSQLVPLWFAECSLSSVAIYLLLLRSAVRRTYPS